MTIPDVVRHDFRSVISRGCVNTGASTETITLPEGVACVGDLVPHLTAKSDGHALALKNLQAVRVAVNRSYGDLDTPVTDGDEVAFFPPVTGG